MGVLGILSEGSHLHLCPVVLLSDFKNKPRIHINMRTSEKSQSKGYETCTYDSVSVTFLQ